MSSALSQEGFKHIDSAEYLIFVFQTLGKKYFFQ